MGSPSEPVARRYQAVIGENQHRAGTLHLAVDILDALREILTLRDEKSYKLRLIGGAAAEFGKMHVAVQKLTLEFVDIADFRNSHNRETPQMAVDYDRLGVGVADYAYAGATGELIQISLELGAEIRAFQIMDRAAELISLPNRTWPYRLGAYPSENDSRYHKTSLPRNYPSRPLQKPPINNVLKFYSVLKFESAKLSNKLEKFKKSFNATPPSLEFGN